MASLNVLSVSASSRKHPFVLFLFVKMTSHPNIIVTLWLLFVTSQPIPDVITSTWAGEVLLYHKLQVVQVVQDMSYVALRTQRPLIKYKMSALSWLARMCFCQTMTAINLNERWDLWLRVKTMPTEAFELSRICILPMSDTQVRNVSTQAFLKIFYQTETWINE